VAYGRDPHDGSKWIRLPTNPRIAPEAAELPPIMNTYRLSLDASDIVVTSRGTHIPTLARETEAIVGGTGHAQNQRLRH
jgi:hypothetical protein